MPTRTRSAVGPSSILYRAWSATPRDGPVAFIVTKQARRILDGTWVPLRDPEPFFRDALARLLNAPLDTRDTYRWLIADQRDAHLPLGRRLTIKTLYDLLRNAREAAR